jgi:hypothetical protein
MRSWSHSHHIPACLSAAASQLQVLLYEVKGTHASWRNDALAAKLTQCTHPLNMEAEHTTIAARTQRARWSLLRRISQVADSARASFAVTPQRPSMARASRAFSILDPFHGPGRAVHTQRRVPAWTLAEQDCALKLCIHDLGWRLFGRGVVGQYTSIEGHSALVLEVRVQCAGVPPSRARSCQASAVTRSSPQYARLHRLIGHSRSCLVSSMSTQSQGACPEPRP